MLFLDRYEAVEPIGRGSFGDVYKAIDHDTSQYVAIKFLNPTNDQTALFQEVHALRNLDHTKIVNLKRAARQYNMDFLVFEYMDGSLRHLMNDKLKMRTPFSEADVKSLGTQLLEGLDFMHREKRFMHRDLKPANLLVDKNGVLKIGDLGSATEIKLSNGMLHNHYVTTRNYRAPEMLFRMFLGDERHRPFEYDEKVDMWAVGVILAEMLLMQTLFMPSMSSEEHLHEICKVLGAPTCDAWKYWPKLYPEKGVGLRAMMPLASKVVIDLIESLCSWDPSKRPSALEALQHPFFKRPENVVHPPPQMSKCHANNVVPSPTRVSSQPCPTRNVVPPPLISTCHPSVNVVPSPPGFSNQPCLNKSAAPPRPLVFSCRANVNVLSSPPGFSRHPSLNKIVAPPRPPRPRPPRPRPPRPRPRRPPRPMFASPLSPHKVGDPALWFPNLPGWKCSSPSPPPAGFAPLPSRNKDGAPPHSPPGFSCRPPPKKVRGPPPLFSCPQSSPITKNMVNKW